MRIQHDEISLLVLIKVIFFDYFGIKYFLNETYANCQNERKWVRTQQIQVIE